MYCWLLEVGTPVVVEIEGEPLGSLPEPVAVAVYLSCLDAVENAVIHAEDGVDVRLVLRRDEHGVHFAVADAGAGFDPAATAPDSGLARIADRVWTLGGSVSVEPSSGRGTSLTAQIPLERSAG